MRLKIRKGDTVEIISGRLEDKGKRGEVITVMTAPTRVVVQGVNIRTKHQRQMQTQAGRQIKPGRIQFEAPDRHCARHAGVPQVRQGRPRRHPAGRYRSPPRVQELRPAGGLGVEQNR